jgi:hypothetical protein
MEIGGYDTILKTNDPVELSKEIVAFIDWPLAVTEHDNLDERDFFFYQNQACKNAWDEEGAEPALENTMIYFLIRDDHLTVVTDESLTKQIRNKFNKLLS